LKRHPRQIVAYDAALCKRHITSAVQANRFVPLRLGCGPARLQTSKHFSREMKRYRDELHTCARHKHAFTIFPSPVGGQPPYGPSSRALAELSFAAHPRSPARRDHKKLGHSSALHPAIIRSPGIIGGCAQQSGRCWIKAKIKRQAGPADSVESDSDV
jgi:hypothetical protein